MESQQRRMSFSPPAAFPPMPNGPLKPAEVYHTPTMDVDMAMTDSTRDHRAASVLSGMSAEDMEAAETLNSLHTHFRSPSQVQPAPTHLQTTTSFPSDTEPEPLLTLLTSQHPLAASLINGSLSAYKTTQSYIPGAHFVERHVGLPLAGTISRVTGVEGGIRWALQRRESAEQGQNRRGSELGSAGENGNVHDVEKGFRDMRNGGQIRRSSQLSFAESLPAYDESGRSPPYQEQQLALQQRERQPPPGWRTQLFISTSSLGVAMSEESLRSLRYCLNWLTWANQRLGGAIQSLKDLLHQWEQGQDGPPGQSQPMGSTNANQDQESRLAALSSRIAALKADVLSTLKQVVEVVSNYAGGALPDNARSLVHRHLTSLPQRFSLASSISNTEGSSEVAGSAHRVMVLAQEGLDMMSQVSRVVNDTLVSAESWCEKLGRRRQESQGRTLMVGDVKARQNGEDGVTIEHRENTDVKMEM